MKGVNYVTNQEGQKIGLFIDLLDHDKNLQEYLDDLMDIIEINRRKKEETISWKEAKKQLKKNGKLE